MGDLIERKTIIEAVKNYGKDAISAGRKRLDPVDDIVELCNTLAALTAVDAVPVVHGRWIPRNDEWFDFYQCSACHVHFWTMRAAYCPNCGAKMDGKKDAK